MKTIEQQLLTLINKIIDDRLDPIEQAVIGLQKKLKDGPSEITPKGGRMMSTLEAMRYIGVKRSKMSELVRADILRPHNHDDIKGVKHLFSRSTLDNFVNTPSMDIRRRLHQWKLDQAKGEQNKSVVE